VCDIAMPGEDGYSLIRRIRALGASRGGDVPAVAVTALARVGDRQRALAAGFQNYLTKPVDIDGLAQAVAELSCRPPAAPFASSD
jgi:CheY-like chemotaxis protein